MSDLLPIVEPPRKPDLPGTVVVRPDAEEVIDALAADLMVQAMTCVRKFGSFQLALSGGSTPLPLYKRLMYDPLYRELPWRKTHLWIVDERRVSFSDDRSNYKHIDELIGQHADIPHDQVHPMMALAENADELYEKAMADVMMWRERGHDRLDFVVLGMGGDGHTASLFPRSPALMADLASMKDESVPRRMVRINAGANVTPPDRVTMTLPLLNAARFVAVMVTGEGKREMIGKIERRESAVEDLPIVGVQPRAGELRWYLDHAACPQ